MMTSVYGPIHPDITLCYRLMARMSYAMGDFADALAQQNKALMISERYSGVDHCETIIDYVSFKGGPTNSNRLFSKIQKIYQTNMIIKTQKL
jgi:protein TIF31